MKYISERIEEELPNIASKKECSDSFSIRIIPDSFFRILSISFLVILGFEITYNV